MDTATFRVQGISNEKDRITVTNAIHKYSGVMNVDVNLEKETVTVVYDPNNITVGDMSQDIERENYQVELISNED